MIATANVNTPEVRDRVRETRAAVAVEAAVERMSGGIYVVGNAPTALLRLIELIRAGNASPALVIGLPVGFVNAADVAFNPRSPSQIYVLDSGNGRVQKGDLVEGRFAVVGRGLELSDPSGIDVDPLNADIKKV